jgi:hypothetical protein
MQTNLRGIGRLAVATSGALLAALLMAGCHDDTPPSSATVVTPPASSTTVTAPGATTTTTTMPGGVTPDTKMNTNAGPGTSNGTDTATADAVNTAIVHNKQMTGSRVEAVVTGGVATLNGQVQNQQQKALAESSARQVPGVTSIKNKLIIVTTGGAKPKPTVITKTVVVHDKAAPASPAPSASSTNAPPPPPDASGAPSTAPAPAATGGTNTAGNP